MKARGPRPGAAIASAAAPGPPEGIRPAPGAIEVDIQVVPRASREGLGPILGGRIKVHVSAPPVDGAANAAVRELLASLLGISRGHVSLVRGETGRKKTLRIEGEPGALVERLLALVAGGTEKNRGER